MIFPEYCKYVGRSSSRPSGEKIYFLTQYIVVDTDSGYEVREISLDQNEKGIMRTVKSSRVLASGNEISWYPEKVQLHDRTRLIKLAYEGGSRCTIFLGYDEHLTFVIDPDPTLLTHIHVYDISPPRPSLSACIQDLERAGLFGRLSLDFCHHIHDISCLNADIYPCRAAGFERTLDSDPLFGGERVAGCLTCSQIISECYGIPFTLESICPLDKVSDEPFIARCCRSEREGVGIYRGRFGAVVHWGADPATISERIFELVKTWRAR